MAVELDKLAKRDRVIVEALARDEDFPVEQVGEIYRIECMQLEEVARIKTYVPVLASKLARSKLREIKQAAITDSAQ